MANRSRGTIFKLAKYKTDAVEYSSATTRQTSLDCFLGGAEGEETLPGMISFPGEMKENLEARFKSGVNRTDTPHAWGYPNVDRPLANTRFMLADDLKAWRRQKGEVIYKK